MFNCNVCCKTSKPGEPQHRVVVEKRPRVYTNTIRQLDDDDERPKVSIHTSHGWEIVREAKLCGACATLRGTSAVT